MIYKKVGADGTELTVANSCQLPTQLALTFALHKAHAHECQMHLFVSDHADSRAVYELNYYALGVPHPWESGPIPHKERE